MMNYKKPPRRLVLKQLASMSALGAVASLRSLPLLADERLVTAPAAIPGIQGRVIRRQDENYELWRQSMVWHLSKPDRYPDMIIQARSDRDVVAAVRYAANNNLKITTRSGGHNATGASLRDGGVLVDLSTLSDVRIDVDRRIASIQPGVRSRQLVTAARDRGLSFPVPHCPSVGLGGFVMGGGIGWNYGHRGGIASFSIAAADVVTADGRLVVASAGEHPDLLWAIRGAGPGFFGVVTRFHLRLYPVPKTILVNSYIHSIDDLANVTSALDRLMEIKDDRIEVITLLMHRPDAPAGAPAAESKICFVSVFAFADSDDEARTLLAPFARSVLAKQGMTKTENQEFSYEDLYNKFFSTEDATGRMARYAVDNVMTNEPGKTLHALADHFRRAPSRYNHVLAAYGMNLQAREDACFSSIADHYVGCFAVWDREENDDLNFNWLDQTLPLMDPFAKGHYVNEVEARLHPERIRQCFSAANWERLQRLRRKYDPDGVFHTYLGYT